jgi:hypothetical protein
MHISDEAKQFLEHLMNKQSKSGVRIGYNEKSK